MIGILCSTNKEKKLAERFGSILEAMNANSAITMFFFTIGNLSIEDMTATGILLSGKEINITNLRLPRIIVNLSNQINRQDIKKFRRLQEIEDIELINEVNRFNQLMIMDILASNKSTKKYLIPYEEDSHAGYRYNDFKSFILIPKKGSKISKIVIVKSQENSFKIIKSNKIQWCSSESINNYINYIKNDRNYIILKNPNCDDEKLIIRVYIQKINQETWRYVGKRVFANELKSLSADKDISDIAIFIIKYITCFIPRIGNCFIDFILDSSNRPCFIHLGGYDKYVLFNGEEHQLSNDFIINLINYAYSFTEDGGRNNVG